MPLGIRPTNDFASKKTFGTPENQIALLSFRYNLSERELHSAEGETAQPHAFVEIIDARIAAIRLTGVWLVVEAIPAGAISVPKSLNTQPGILLCTAAWLLEQR